MNIRHNCIETVKKKLVPTIIGIRICKYYFLRVSILLNNDVLKKNWVIQVLVFLQFHGADVELQSLN